jgi:flavin reductase (DIM6/NTAB) family NADH-FMN oxidoreductase RutF
MPNVPTPLSDAALYREAIARFATGVTVITTTTDQGPAGMTASAVCSLSLEPVQLLVCVSARLPTHTALEQAGHFAVNVLGEGQEHLAMRFGRRTPNKFAGLKLRDDAPVPVLSDAIAYFVCRVAERHPGGDHSIFIGTVVECAYDAERKPLLYFASQFEALQAPHLRRLDAYLTTGG